MKKSILLLALCLVGCATVDQSELNVGVNSFARPGAETRKSFILLPSDQGRSAEDLEFIEFAAHVERAMLSRGYTKGESIETAELAIFLAYGIGEPKDQTYTYSLPLWGQTGVSSSTTTGRVNVYGNTGTFTTNTTHTPQYGIQGYATQQGSYTTFTRHAFLTAYDLVEYRQKKTERVLWETRIASVGSSGDLRRVFPIMIAASRPYFGVSTGKVMDVSLFEDDVSVFEVKGLPIPEPVKREPIKTPKMPGQW